MCFQRLNRWLYNGIPKSSTNIPRGKPVYPYDKLNFR